MSSDMQSGARYFDTIVIGAGTSGLACAARLFQHQARNGGVGTVKVLEARNRIGGRVGSVHLNGCRLDPGANWIHGIGTPEKPNPLMAILPHKRYRELGESVMFRPPERHEGFHAKVRNGEEQTADAWVHVEPHGKTSDSKSEQLIIPPEPAGKLRKAMWSTISHLHEAAASISPNEAKRTSVLGALKRSATFMNTFKTLEPDYHSTLSGILQFIENMEAAPLVAQSAERSEEQVGFSLLEYAIDDFEGEQVFLQDGYIAIIDELAKDLVDAELIEVDVEVEQIKWDENPIVLHTSAGRFEARNVVCTIPLGVLKEQQQLNSWKRSTSTRDALFQPQLPAEKMEAITSLGFGTLDKIFLVYSQPWWTQEPYSSFLRQGCAHHRPDPIDSKSEPDSFMGFTPEPDSMRGFTMSLSGFAIQEDGTVISGPRNLSVINLHALTGFPVLSAFVSCANARQVESMCNDDAGKLVRDALTTWFGRATPKPEAVHVTRWAQDPFSRGSYTNMITGVSEKRHREAFQAPLISESGATLRFAGEHTSSDHFATVHGALLSGWREADDILKNLVESSPGRDDVGLGT